jgi:hypothetical protein
MVCMINPSTVFKVPESSDETKKYSRNVRLSAKITLARREREIYLTE